ncbi:MAG: hypothetical protein ACHQ7M_21050 [Chloroflexota bacterium]
MGEGEVRTQRTRSVDEQAHGVAMYKLHRILARRRTVQRWYGVLLLSGQAEWGTAGGKDAQVQTALEQAGHQRNGVEYVLKIVEHKEDTVAADGVLHTL